MHRGREERKEDIEADTFNYFLILGLPGNVIKERLSTFPKSSFALPNPQCPGLL